MAEDLLSLLTRNGVVTDGLDLRDLPYVPPLTRLRRGLLPPDGLFGPVSPDTGLRAPGFGIRDQGPTGRCTGFALAALIDMQRRLQADADDDLAADQRVSSEMLYQLARLHDLYTGDAAQVVAQLGQGPSALRPRRDGLRSLRSVLKAFYHHGVCLEEGGDPAEMWPDPYRNPGPPLPPDSDGRMPEDDDVRFPTTVQARAARGVPLGAYYRLSPILHHYHAALTDTGTVLVAARVHSGWLPDRVAATKGIIEPNADPAQDAGASEIHAFVLVGYDDHGFLVLNSWGPGWGGYRGFAGIALWRYADWARSVIDGWVLRLGVPAPDSFDYTMGRQGAPSQGDTKSGSTPCIALIGHYLTLEDGDYTRMGAYPSSPALLENSLQALSRSDARGVVLWMASGLHQLGDAFTAAAKRRPAIEAMGLYPLTLFWAGNFGEAALQALEDSADRTARIAGANGTDAGTLRDRVFESEVRGIGRAIWREVQSNALRAVWGDARPFQDSPAGPAFDLLRQVLHWAGPRRLELHLVAEGTGALVLDALVSAVPGRPGDLQRAWEVSLTSIQLCLPAITMDQARGALLPLVAGLNRKPVADPDAHGDAGAFPVTGPLSGRLARGRIYLPDKDIEQRIHLGSYGRGFLDAVANACERRDPRTGEPPVMLGHAAAASTAPFGLGDSAMDTALTRISGLGGAVGRYGRVHQLTFDSNPVLESEMLRTLRHLPRR